MKRILLFIATNLAILLVLSAIAALTGLDAWLARQGESLAGLLAFAAFFGFSGALISLALSKWLARRTMGLRLIDAPANTAEQWLLETVRQLSQRAGIATPEVGVFEAASRTLSPPGRAATARWWPSAPGCSPRCSGMKSKPCSGTRSHISPTVTW